MATTSKPLTQEELLAAMVKPTRRGTPDPLLAECAKISLEEIDSFGDKQSITEMFKDVAKYNKMLGEKITFINDSLTAAIPFTRENLYLICAYTGSGKSTAAANISYPLWKQKKKVLVISNEETKQDVLFRIGCLDLGYNFNDYKKGEMPLAQQKEVLVKFEEIATYVKVIDVNYKNGITICIEGIKNLLNAIKEADYSCVMIDYYQLIQCSVEDKTRGRYDVLNDLRIWMGQYIKKSNIPIVLFAQLHSIGKRANKDLDSRIQECPNVQQPATVVLELIPDFNNGTSEFIIHKDRFGLAGKTIVCGFDRGRYVNFTDEVAEMIAKRMNTKKLKEVDDILKKMDEPPVLPPALKVEDDKH